MDVADKYAVAFLNVYGNKLTLADVKNIDQAARFLAGQRRALLLLQVPLIARSIKLQGLRELSYKFALIAPINTLVAMLLDHKRAYLLAAVMKAIVYRYEKQHYIHTIIIKSAMKLPERYQHDIVQFIDRQVSGTKQYQYEIDTTLIAGVRIQSDTFLWEYSIDKKLRELAHAHS